MSSPTKHGEWQAAAESLECPLERIEFARMIFEDIAHNLYASDGDPIVHESLIGRRTAAVEAAFDLYRRCENTELGELRWLIRSTVQRYDPYLLRQSAQWSEFDRRSSSGAAKGRMRADEIELLMAEVENAA